MCSRKVVFTLPLAQVWDGWRARDFEGILQIPRHRSKAEPDGCCSNALLSARLQPSTAADTGAQPSSPHKAMLPFLCRRIRMAWEETLQKLCTSPGRQTHQHHALLLQTGTGTLPILTLTSATLPVKPFPTSLN